MIAKNRDHLVNISERGSCRTFDYKRAASKLWSRMKPIDQWLAECQRSNAELKGATEIVLDILEMAGVLPPKEMKKCRDEYQPA